MRGRCMFDRYNNSGEAKIVQHTDTQRTAYNRNNRTVFRGKNKQ